MSASAIRLEPVSYSVESLLQRVRGGEIRVPRFQRDFRWTAGDVAKLFDSINRSYPIGTLLFWKRRGEAQRLRVGHLEFNAMASENVLWAIDGQQRITSLVNVLLVDNPRRPFSLFFDLEAERIQLRPPKKAVPMAVLVDSERLVDWLSGSGLDQEARRRALRLGSRLREYRLPAWTVETESEPDIRAIFSRLNSLGKRIKPDEIFEALESQPAASLADTAAKLARFGFGAIPKKLIHQTLLAAQGDDFTSDRVGRLKEPEAFARVEEALGSAIVFLRQEGIPHLKLLPYNLALVVLGAFFAHHPTIAPRTRELLARWLWRAFVSQQLSGKDLIWLRKILRAVALEETAALEELLRSTERPDPSTWNVEQTRFDLRSAHSRIEALALLARAGPARLDGVARAMEAKQTVLREFLPLVRMYRDARRAGRALKSEAALLLSVANRGVWLEGGWTELAEMKAIDAALGLPTPEEQVRALLSRREHLNDWIHRFLESRMRTLASDRPSIDALVLHDEETDAA